MQLEVTAIIKRKQGMC